MYIGYVKTINGYDIYAANLDGQWVFAAVVEDSHRPSWDTAGWWSEEAAERHGWLD